MGTKAEVKFKPYEHMMVKAAMKSYRQDVTGFQLKLFDIPYKKVIDSQDGKVHLDGMEMELIKRALNKYGWLHYMVQRKEKAKTYFNLAAWIKEQKLNFQKENGPKLKATSAGTLIALR